LGQIKGEEGGKKEGRKRKKWKEAGESGLIED
jgi:hypothetical protein